MYTLMSMTNAHTLMLPVSLDCSFLMTLSVFSRVYIYTLFINIICCFSSKLPVVGKKDRD